MVHGGDGALGQLDFSSGVAPFPPPPSILEAYRAADLTRYPHPTALPLRQAIAAHEQLSVEQVVAGHGSVELIWALARAFVGAGRRALVLTPAFGEYQQAIRASGGQWLELRADPPDLSWSLDRLATLLAKTQPALVFLGRPSNPCLTGAPDGALDELARRFPEILFAIDEAYLPLFEGLTAVRPQPNIALLRSLTKVFALPGLRLGYLTADAAVARAVQVALPPWNVSQPAQRAGLAAVDELRQIPEIRSAVARLRRNLVTVLRHAGASVEREGGPFVLCRVQSAARASCRLAEHNIRVRDCTSFGLPHHLRIGIRPEHEQRALASAFREIA